MAIGAQMLQITCPVTKESGVLPLMPTTGIHVGTVIASQ